MTGKSTSDKVPADAPGYPLGGPEPKTREQLIAEQETRDNPKPGKPDTPPAKPTSSAKGA